MDTTGKRRPQRDGASFRIADFRHGRTGLWCTVRGFPCGRASNGRTPSWGSAFKKRHSRLSLVVDPPGRWVFVFRRAESAAFPAAPPGPETSAPAAGSFGLRRLPFLPAVSVKKQKSRTRVHLQVMPFILYSLGGGSPSCEGTVPSPRRIRNSPPSLSDPRGDPASFCPCTHLTGSAEETPAALRRRLKEEKTCSGTVCGSGARSVSRICLAGRDRNGLSVADPALFLPDGGRFHLLFSLGMSAVRCGRTHGAGTTRPRPGLRPRQRRAPDSRRCRPRAANPRTTEAGRARR